MRMQKLLGNIEQVFGFLDYFEFSLLWIPAKVSNVDTIQPWWLGGRALASKEAWLCYGGSNPAWGKIIPAINMFYVILPELLPRYVYTTGAVNVYTTWEIYSKITYLYLAVLVVFSNSHYMTKICGMRI